MAAAQDARAPAAAVRVQGVALSRAPRFAALPPLSLYVHVPWCARKCPYCDFNSHEARGEVPESDYVAALVADLEAALPEVWGRPVHTVFFGGGTPSLLSVGALDAILAALRARLPIAPDAEITLEANPGTVDAARFAGFRAAGVNRLSLGVQSFDDRLLHAIGRIHDGAGACRAAALALQTFERVNFDLMYALPGQDQGAALSDLRRALDFGPEHLSIYHLTIEPNTRFASAPPPLPDEEAGAAMQEAAEALLATAGYRHYETSAWARPGAECRHNLNYWRFGDYLGIGAGAHSKISFPDRIVRSARHRHPRRYMAGAASGDVLQSRHEVAREDLGFEFMMNALRLADGFPLRLFEERTGLPSTAVLAGLEAAERRKLIERDALCVRPTPLGRRFLNELLQIFLPAEQAD